MRNPYGFEREEAKELYTLAEEKRWYCLEASKQPSAGMESSTHAREKWGDREVVDVKASCQTRAQ
ncbi:MAG: hypothetical protein ACLU4N_10680 [Butyricimonas faecihominis]